VVYIDAALRRLGDQVHGDLLDVGCGRRPHEAALGRRVRRYVGLDWPARPERAGPDVVGDALRLPFLPHSFDTVLATELLEHLPAPGAFLAEVARVLRPGGALLVSVPFMEPLHEEPRDYTRFTAYGLRYLLEAAGFHVEHLLGKGGWFSVVLGSFLNQALYLWANPEDGQGRRRDNPLVLALVLPCCAAAQVLAYALDRVIPSRRYALGYVAMARQPAPPAEPAG
jgi:SAM-dependent methyltransferase